MMSGDEYGSQEGRGTEPSVHERIQNRNDTARRERGLYGSQPTARHAGIEFI